MQYTGYKIITHTLFLLREHFTKKGKDTKIRINALRVMKTNEIHKKEDVGIIFGRCGQGSGGMRTHERVHL